MYLGASQFEKFKNQFYGIMELFPHQEGSRQALKGCELSS